MKPIILASSIADSGPHIVKNFLAKSSSCLFIMTAAEVESGDKEWLDNDRLGLSNTGLRVEDYSITGKSRVQIAEKIRQFDVIHVNGGNSFYLLHQMRRCGFKEILNEFVPSKKIYIGSSAGAIVAGPDIEPARKIEDTYKAPELTSTLALGLVDVCVLPHWGSDIFKELYMQHPLEHIYQKGYRLILLNDDQYVVWQEGKFSIEDIHE